AEGGCACNGENCPCCRGQGQKPAKTDTVRVRTAPVPPPAVLAPPRRSGALLAPLNAVDRRCAPARAGLQGVRARLLEPATPPAAPNAPTAPAPKKAKKVEKSATESAGQRRLISV